MPNASLSAGGFGWSARDFGGTGYRVMPLGLGASYGLATRDVERAAERGINYLYWGAAPRPAFGRAVRLLARNKREKLVIVTQQYSSSPKFMRLVLEWQLRHLKIDYTDFLLLGNWTVTPPAALLDAVAVLREEGKVKNVMISCHDRAVFEQHLNSGLFDAIMVRYNAAHPGAEKEVFPLVAEARPGVVAYTATRWGTLLNSTLVPAGEPTPRASDCYRFALSHPAVDVCLTGARNAAELDEAFIALDKGPLSPDEMTWMRRVGASVRVNSVPTALSKALGR